MAGARTRVLKLEFFGPGSCIFFLEKKSIALHTAHVRVTHGTRHAARPHLDGNVPSNLSLQKEPRVVASRAVFKRDTYQISKSTTFSKDGGYVAKNNASKPKPGLGLGPGSSSQYSMYWLRHMPVHWTRPVHWWFRRSPNRSRLAATSAPPRLMRGARRRRPRRAPLESPCRRPVFARFGVTIINTSYQKSPFGSGDYPDKLLFRQALN